MAKILSKKKRLIDDKIMLLKEQIKEFDILKLYNNADIKLKALYKWAIIDVNFESATYMK